MSGHFQASELIVKNAARLGTPGFALAEALYIALSWMETINPAESEAQYLANAKDSVYNALLSELSKDSEATPERLEEQN